MECMGVVSGCGEQEAGVASGSGWNIWLLLVGVVVRRYYRFPHTTYPFSSYICSFFEAASLLFVHFKNVFSLYIHQRLLHHRASNVYVLNNGHTIWPYRACVPANACTITITNFYYIPTSSLNL